MWWTESGGLKVEERWREKGDGKKEEKWGDDRCGIENEDPPTGSGGKNTSTFARMLVPFRFPK